MDKMDDLISIYRWPRNEFNVGHELASKQDVSKLGTEPSEYCQG